MAVFSFQMHKWYLVSTECQNWQLIGDKLVRLMQVTVKREEEFVQQFVMSSKYTLAGKWSSIGASLNFWSGITVVLVAEVMEMIYRIIIDHASDKDKTKIKTINNERKEIDD